MKIRSIAPLALIALVTLASAVFLRDWLSFETLRANRAALIAFRDSQYLAALLVYVAAYVAMVTFSIPGAVFMTLVGGFLFGTVIGGVLTVFGATIGAVLLFLAARRGVGVSVERYLDSADARIAGFKAALLENEVSALLIMRLVPVVPFFVANLLPAVLGVRLRSFALTTFFGIMPGTFVFSSIGAGLGATFDAGEAPRLDVLFEPHIILPLLGLACLAALPILQSTLGRKGKA